MTETMTRQRAIRWDRTVPVYVGAAIVWLAFALAMMRDFEDFPRAELTVRNETAWDLTLYKQTESAISPLLSIDRGRDRVISEIIVPGEIWHFVWRFAGDDIAVSAVAHDELRRPGFVLAVPAAAERTLRAMGATPSP